MIQPRRKIDGRLSTADQPDPPNPLGPNEELLANPVLQINDKNIPVLGGLARIVSF